jgi:hypothetical protein
MDMKISVRMPEGGRAGLIASAVSDLELYPNQPSLRVNV